jgi:hypothetical protein
MSCKPSVDLQAGPSASRIGIIAGRGSGVMSRAPRPEFTRKASPAKQSSQKGSSRFCEKTPRKQRKRSRHSLAWQAMSAWRNSPRDRIAGREKRTGASRGHSSAIAILNGMKKDSQWAGRAGARLARLLPAESAVRPGKRAAEREFSLSMPHSIAIKSAVSRKRPIILEGNKSNART